MTFYFLDTSALIKRYVVETGFDWIKAITAASAHHTLFVAHITQAEIVSGLSRRRREGSINVRTARTLRLLIDRHCERQYQIVNISHSVIQVAEDLLEQHPLRAYDAVQLACAIETFKRLEQANLPSLTFISSDNRLLEAAILEKLMVENPNDHRSP